MGKVTVKVFRSKEGVSIPKYNTDGSVGFDFHAPYDGVIFNDEVVGYYYAKDAEGNEFKRECRFNHPLAAGLMIKRNHLEILTGLKMEIPEGYELEIRGRSGLRFKFYIKSYNGTIDNDFRGEIRLLLENVGTEPFYFKKGDRLAQGIIKKIVQVDFKEVYSESELEPTERGEGGLGSTGL